MCQSIRHKRNHGVPSYVQTNATLAAMLIAPSKWHFDISNNNNDKITWKSGNCEEIATRRCMAGRRAACFRQ